MRNFRHIPKPNLLFAILLVSIFAQISILTPVTVPSVLAVIDPELQGPLSAAGPLDTVGVVVTFTDRQSVNKLDTVALSVKFQVLPMATAYLTKTQIDTISLWPEVRGIWNLHTELRIHLDESRPIVKADQAAAKFGVTGRGVTAAVVDTGADTTHPDLAGRIRNFEVNGGDGAPCSFVENPNSDDIGHGTQVSGVIAGNGVLSGGQFTGMAPEANIISYDTNAGLFIILAEALCAFDDILARFPEVRVVNNSWGGGSGREYNPTEPVSVASKELYDGGVVPEFSAGNSGPGDNTLTRQAVSPYVISTGATTKPNQLVMFSSRGRPLDNHNRDLAQQSNSGLYRPTISAPGHEITMPCSVNQPICDGIGAPHTYGANSGTSFSGPMTVGVVALMLQSNPRLTTRQVTDIVEGTATDLPGYFAHEVGAGLLNALDAVTIAQRLSEGANVPIPKKVFSEGPAPIDHVTYPYQERFIPLQTFRRIITVAPNTDRLFVDAFVEETVATYSLRLFAPGVPVVVGDEAQFDSTTANDYLFIEVRRPVAGDWTLRVGITQPGGTFLLQAVASIYKTGTEESPSKRIGLGAAVASTKNSVSPGGTTSFVVRLTNLGTVDSSFTVTATGPTGWTFTYDPTSVSLRPGQTQGIKVVIAAPSDAQKGSQVTIYFTASSVPQTSTDPIVQVSTQGTVSVKS